MRNHHYYRWVFPVFCLSLTFASVNSAYAAQFPLRVRPVLIRYRIATAPEDTLGARPAEYIHPKLKTGETRGKRNPT
jgi:hypothetical protein